MKRTIHKQTREELKRIFPNLDSYNCSCKREDHWNLLKVFMFSHYIDKETGSVRIGAETIARATNKLSQFVNNRFNAGAIIAHFITDIIPNCITLVTDEQGREWSKSTWTTSSDGSFTKTEEGKQRRALVNWPTKVKEVITNELNNSLSDEKVYISNGNKKNSAQERMTQKNIKEECTNRVEILDCEPAKEIASYLNDLPTNSFTKIIDNYEKALKTVLSIKNINSRQSQLVVLDTIIESPKPFVKPVENTDRLFGFGANITNLKKEVRKVLTTGWFEGDLKSAQLAIVARLWNIKEVKDFLKSGKSFWKEMESFLSASEEDKSVIKDFTYGIIFGMSKERVLEEMVIGSLSVGERFLSHPVISALLKARTKYINQAIKAGFITDAFGKKLEVTKKNVLSLVARQAQSYEMALIYPVFELAKTTKDFTVTLYQFDGVSLAFHNERTKEFWISEIKKAVLEKAEQLDITTSLDVSENKTTEIKKVDSFEFRFFFKETGKFQPTLSSYIEEQKEKFKNSIVTKEIN